VSSDHDGIALRTPPSQEHSGCSQGLRSGRRSRTVAARLLGVADVDPTHSSILRTFEAQNPRSRAHAERARQIVPTGMSRALLRHAPFATYTAEASGLYATDLDGHRRVDFHGNYAALIHGHAHPAIVDAVTEQLHKGTAYSSPAQQEWALAAHLTSRIESVERIVFNNSGTESVLVALRAARAYTGRQRIGKFEGGYHGFSDMVMVAGHGLPSPDSNADLPEPVWDTAGLPATVDDDVVVMRYNDVDSVRDTLRRCGHTLAAVIVEPMLGSAGVIPADPAFLAALREETARAGVLLICDEVISLRQAVGGLQSVYSLEPDLTTMAKIIGGGFPIGAVGGRAAVMAVFEEQSHERHVANLGTFSANPISLTAGRVAMERLDAAAIERINTLGERARQGLQSVIDRHALRARVTGLGSMFQLHWTARPVRDARAAEHVDADLKLLTFLGLANRGFQISMRGMCCLSTPMDTVHIDDLVHAFEDTVAELIADGWGDRLQLR